MPVLVCSRQTVLWLRGLSVLSVVLLHYAPAPMNYTLSLHDALPICWPRRRYPSPTSCRTLSRRASRSEEHTSELQSLRHLVCRLLLEKKNHTSIPRVHAITLYASITIMPNTKHLELLIIPGTHSHHR